MKMRPLLKRVLLGCGMAALLAASSAFAGTPGKAIRAAARPAKAGAQRNVLPVPAETKLNFGPAGKVVPGITTSITRSAEINFADLARMEARQRQIAGPPPERVLVPSELNESEAETESGPPAAAPSIVNPPQLNIASPSPTNSFQGLDDIAMVDSGYFVIPPDVGGAVGPTKVMDTSNRIWPGLLVVCMHTIQRPWIGS